MKRLLLICVLGLFLASLPATAQISFVGECHASTTACTPPAHQVGDLFIVMVGVDATSTVPTIPSPYVTVTTYSINGTSTADSAAAIVCKVATTTSETVTGFTSATSIVALIYRGQRAGLTAVCASTILGTPTKTTSSINTTTTTVNYGNSGTTTNGDAASWDVGLAYAPAATAGLGTAPTNMTARSLAGSTKLAGNDTNGTAATFPTANVTVTTAGRVMVAVIEIKAAQLTAPSFDLGTGTYGTSVTITPTIPASSSGCYTSDGTIPAASTLGTCSNGSTFTSGTIALSFAWLPVPFKMLATRSAWSNSSETDATYTLNPFRPNLPAIGVAGGGAVAPLLDASCTGSGTANYLQCSAAMTVTAGDAIVCNIAAQSVGSTLTGTVIDSLNGPYGLVYGTTVAGTANPSFAGTAVLENSLGGSVVPIAYYKASPGTQSTINCKAWKNVATSYILDGGAVEQTTSASVINPTSGSAQAPTNNNELVVAYMSRNNATAPNAGSFFSPSGALALVGASGMRQADEYQIQSTATSVNGSFTGNTTAQDTVDTQLAILPIGTTGGYRSLTGFYLPLGAAGSAPTGTVTGTTLGGATSYLTTIIAFSASPFWTVTGTPTYDTAINPTATGKIMVAQVAHTFGDAGSSVKYTQAATGSSQVQDQWLDHGEGDWLWSFYRISGTGVVNNDFCDILDDKGGVTSLEMTAQMEYRTNDVGFILESTDGAVVSGSQRLSIGNLVNTDMRVGMHIASVNERYHVLKVQTKSGSVWSDAFTLNYDNLCTSASVSPCTTPAAIASPTGTNSSGSTAMTLSSGTGTVNGQILLDPTNSCLKWPTRIDSGGGTASITLSQPSTCAVNGTTVNFYSKPTELVTATNGTVSAGSTAMTIVAPTTGVIATGQSIGGSGIRPGTIVSAISGTSLTLSIPAASAMTTDGVSFWNAASSTRIINFGRFASCNTPADQWWSGLLEDEAGTGAFNSPN